MPGLFTPPAAHSQTGSSLELSPPAPQCANAGEPIFGQVTDSGASGARKRSRYNGTFDEAFASAHSFSQSVVGGDSLRCARFPDTRSPHPLANDRYQLAGGMERPGIFSRPAGDFDDYYQLEKQRGMWSMPTSPNAGLPTQPPPASPAQAVPKGTTPWVLSSIFSVVGGVAGRLVRFCSVPFRGFQAGGGQAYIYNEQGKITEGMAREDLFVDTSTTRPMRHSLPGKYPEDDYGVTSFESLDNERPRMSKRLRTGEDWVVVGKDGATESRPGTPRLSERRVPEHTRLPLARSPSQIPRPVSTSSTHTTPKRPSLIPVSRRSTMDRKSLTKTPTRANGSFRSYTRESYGSPVLFQTTTTTSNNTSPLPFESHRLINKIRREELEEDARLRRMSSQMSAMLREAQEALGSKFEIEEYPKGSGLDDEGYGDDMSWTDR